MYKSATKCNETLGKWCKNKHGASKIIDTLETYHGGTGRSKFFDTFPLLVDDKVFRKRRRR
jgi:hypothetical protein